MISTDAILICLCLTAILIVIAGGVIGAVRRSRLEDAWDNQWADADLAEKRELIHTRPQRNDFAEVFVDMELEREIRDLEDMERLKVDADGLPLARKAERARKRNIRVRYDDTEDSLDAKLLLHEYLTDYPNALKDMPDSLRR